MLRLHVETCAAIERRNEGEFHLNRPKEGETRLMRFKLSSQYAQEISSRFSISQSPTLLAKHNIYQNADFPVFNASLSQNNIKVDKFRSFILSINQSIKKQKKMSNA